MAQDALTHRAEGNEHRQGVRCQDPRTDCFGCEYCNAAHTFTGYTSSKLSREEIERARQGRSEEPKASAALTFVRQVAETHGKVSQADIGAVREAGFADAQVMEIVAVVAENFFTNLINNVAVTDVDFPDI